MGYYAMSNYFISDEEFISLNSGNAPEFREYLSGGTEHSLPLRPQTQSSLLQECQGENAMRNWQKKEPTKEICRTVLYFILHRCFASSFAYVSRFFACLCFQVGTTTWLEHFLALAELPEKKEKTIQRYLHNRVALFGCLLFVSSVEIQIFMNVFVYLYVFCRNTRIG